MAMIFFIRQKYTIRLGASLKTLYHERLKADSADT